MNRFVGVLLVLHGCSIVGIHCGIDLLGLPANYSTDWKVLSRSHVGIKQHCQTDPVWCYLNCANLGFSRLETKVKSFPFKKLIFKQKEETELDQVKKINELNIKEKTLASCNGI